MAQANRATAAAYRGTAEAAPGQIELLRAARVEVVADGSAAELDLDPDSSLPLLQRRLQEERADLAAVRVRHDDLIARLAYQEARRGAARQQLAEANAAHQAAFADLQAEAGADPGTAPNQHPTPDLGPDTRDRAIASEPGSAPAQQRWQRWAPRQPRRLRRFRLVPLPCLPSAAREAAAAAADGESVGEAEDAPFHEPEVDLSALSDDTRGLIHLGLIILFERPIRVGDTVTVGDTDGVVTRIRMGSN